MRGLSPALSDDKMNHLMKRAFDDIKAAFETASSNPDIHCPYHPHSYLYQLDRDPSEVARVLETLLMADEGGGI